MTNAAHLYIFFIFVFRAYARALQLSPDTSNLWHDLAVAYYYLGQVYERKDFVSSPGIPPFCFSSICFSLSNPFPSQVTREEGDKKKHLMTALNVSSFTAAV